jgi:hypothetical protein
MNSHIINYIIKSLSVGYMVSKKSFTSNNRVRYLHLSSYMIIIILWSLLSTLSGYTANELESLRNNADWLVGKGYAWNESQADRMAVNDLMSQISVQVESSFESITKEENGNLKEYCSSVVKTYTNTRLDAAERNIFEDKGQCLVYRFIRKADKNRIFEERGNLIRDYAQRGSEAEKELRIGDALLNDYWSLILLRTHPDWRTISSEIFGRNECLISYLPDRIHRLFSLLSISAEKPYWVDNDKLSLVKVTAVFGGLPVRNLDLKYYTGNDWSEPFSLSEGKALLEFYSQPEYIPNPIMLNVVYSYVDRAGINADIATVMKEMHLPSFPESQYKVQPDAPKTIMQESKQTNQPEVKNTTNYLETVQRLSRALQTRNFEKVEDLFSKEGKSSFDMMIKNGKARIVDANPELDCSNFDDKTYVRGLSMQFAFPKSGRRFVEPIVCIFGANNKIEKIDFGLSDKTTEDIMGNVQATDAEKHLIRCFIEDYKTAYCLKNLGFVEKVFADNALIIVGSMLKDDNTNIDGMYQKLGKSWAATRYTKQEYIENLRRLFASNEYVNLKFEDNIFTRTNDPSKNVFGIQIHQYYYSQHYADEGYLFLMFDLTDTAKPKIYVRTWQPEKNLDGSIYGLKDFFIN